MRTHWRPLIFGTLGLFLIFLFFFDQTHLQREPANESFRFDLSDVSVLLPLPRNFDEYQDMLGVSGRRKSLDYTLIPSAWTDLLPKPFLINVADAESLPSLRVIAFRLDPCYPWKDDHNCQPMIRLSFQPLQESVAAHTYVALDAAIHAFYFFPQEEFQTLTSTWKEILRQYPRSSTQPLDVPPAAQDPATRASFVNDVTEFLNAHIKQERLTRMTFMTLGGRTNVWDFGGFQKNQQTQTIEAMTIPRTQATVQRVLIHAQPPFSFDGGIIPAPKENDVLNDLLTKSKQPGAPVSDRERRTILKASEVTTFIETPSLISHPERIDCASCHVAQPFRNWAQAMLDDRIDDIPRSSEYDLSSKSELPRLTNQLRAFGYFQTNKIISRRVILESAEVARRLNADH